LIDRVPSSAAALSDCSYFADAVSRKHKKAVSRSGGIVDGSWSERGEGWPVSDIKQTTFDVLDPAVRFDRIENGPKIAVRCKKLNGLRFH